MYYSKIIKYDVSNGPGIRSTIFVSGCTHNCNQCFNKDLHDFKYGNEFTKEIEDKFISYIKDDMVVGVNILGGEPLQQDKTLLNLLKRIKEETGKNIWLWTGYTYDEVIKDTNKKETLRYIDTIIDGKFDYSKRDLNLKYRGSYNQNIINIIDN